MCLCDAMDIHQYLIKMLNDVDAYMHLLNIF